MAPRGRYKRRSRKNARRFLDRPVAYLLESLLCVAAVAVLGKGFYDYIRDSPRFRVKAIIVEGQKMLDGETVKERSGITEDDNLLFLDVRDVRKKVETLPYVKSCTVGRTFPDTVVLRVEEREAFATLMLNNRAYEIDQEANVLRQYPASAMPREPFITNVGGLQFVDLGQKLTQPPVLAALAVWNAFSHTTMAHDVQVSELAAFHEDDIRMYCDELHFELRWGRGNYETQARRLDFLWKEEDKSLACLEYLDLRFDEKLPCK